MGLPRPINTASLTPPMPYPDFQAFLAHLEAKGQLKRVRAEVDPKLEITEIADRLVRTGGPAVLFEKVKGSEIPVAINTYGSLKRMAWALGVEDVEEVAQQIQALLQLKPPSGMLEKLKMLPTLLDMGSWAPKTVSSGICQEVTVDPPSFGKLPILQCWPKDAGRFITLPLVISRDPVTGNRNVGMYRIQVVDDRTALMHWQLHKDGARHAADAKARGKKVEVAVCLGGDPCLPYCATAPLPPQVDELLFAGFLRKKPVELVKARTVDLEVPADCEIVLEGTVDPAETRIEGPFGDHNGYYSTPAPYPVFRLTGMTHRRKPVYPTIVVGIPPKEDDFLGKATERIFLPLVRQVLPEIVDMNLPFEGIFHNLAIVSIRKRYPGHARKVMSAVWGLGQLMFTKVVVVVDHDVDVHDLKQVAWKVGCSIDPRRDLMFADGPLDALDHASPMSNWGSKVGIDATRKGPDEGHTREWPSEIAMDDAVRRRVTDRWPELGL